MPSLFGSGSAYVGTARMSSQAGGADLIPVIRSACPFCAQFGFHIFEEETSLDFDGHLGLPFKVFSEEEVRVFCCLDNR
ncbi:hypothetical protein [Actinocorallia aurantiaca]|uniref:Uncharacterized protein n=1 Tax=Actinocorallia aurantiaca TaxID=46204 RepID=A0ABN3UGP2_9ACTN